VDNEPSRFQTARKDFALPAPKTPSLQKSEVFRAKAIKGQCEIAPPLFYNSICAFYETLRESFSYIFGDFFIDNEIIFIEAEHGVVANSS
jgi:hypothetical protein